MTRPREVGSALRLTAFATAAAIFAPNLAFETTPVENWLEIEVGISSFLTHNITEWDAGPLSKKPWTISKKAEFMLGIGPESVHLKFSNRLTITALREVINNLSV